jgi:hypothetical protein
MNTGSESHSLMMGSTSVQPSDAFRGRETQCSAWLDGTAMPTNVSLKNTTRGRQIKNKGTSLGEELGWANEGYTALR